MGVLAIPLAMMGMALAFAPPMGSQAGTRSILREKVDARGRVGDDLAAKTGWRMARGFRWQILLPDAAGRFQAGTARSNLPHWAGLAALHRGPV